MSLRSVLALSFTTEQVKKHYGIDVRPILKNYGLDNLPPAAMISQADEFSVLADIAPLLSHDPLTPIKIGSNFGLSGYGVLAMMLMNCATIYDAIQLGIRYQDLTFLFSRMRFSLDNEEAAIVLEPCPLPEHLQRFIIDRDLAGTFQFIQLMQSMIGQKGKPLRVDIPYPEPAEANFYRDKLECPVNFNADVVRFVISSALLKEPMPNASSTALALYQQQCDEILQQRKHARTGALSQQIKHYLNLFHDSFPTIVECAEAFGRSERQFRRLLKEEGQQFQQLLDEIKREKAVQLLQQSDLSVERIALQLGYTEAASFIRAFRKWTGSTPAQYRKHPNPIDEYAITTRS